MEAGVTHLENISTWLNLLSFKLLSIKVALSQSLTEGKVTAIRHVSLVCSQFDESYDQKAQKLQAGIVTSSLSSFHSTNCTSVFDAMLDILAQSWSGL
jgi:hypothetical protein